MENLILFGIIICIFRRLKIVKTERPAIVEPVPISPPKTLTIDEIIENASYEYNIDPIMIKAVIMTESSFRPDIITPESKGRYSYGLMQILDETARWLGLTGDLKQLLDPETNIDFGAKYFRYQLNRYDEDYEKAIAAYNAGSVIYKDGHLINEYYVTRVFKYYDQFKREEGYYA